MRLGSKIKRPIRSGLGWAVLILLVVVLLAACGGENGGSNNPEPAGINFPVKGYTRLVEYPADGVRLGQGWHEDQGEKTQSVCIQFEPLQDLGQEQVMSLEVVTDRSEMMESMGVSAEMQVKAMAYQVSGKARFAKEVEVSSESLNFVADARVNNGVVFAGPIAGDAGMTVALAPQYADLARRDMNEFKRQCGEAFVAAIYSGAELSAVLSFSETDSSEREEIEASMKGSGWGFEAEGTASKTMEEYSKKSALKIDYYQSGGEGNPIPTDQQGFTDAIARLPELAADAGKNYQILVRGYESLPNFPGGAVDLESDFRERLAASYGRLWTIYEEITSILQDLDDEPGKWVFGPGMGPDTLRTLQDEIQDKLRQQRELARLCAYAGDDEGSVADEVLTPVCELPEALDATNDYEYRIQLPVLAQDVAIQRPADQVVLCERAVSDLVDRERETIDGDPKNIVNLQRALIAFRDQCIVLSGEDFPELYLESINPQIVDYRVRQVSQFRCDQDIDDPGCLSNGEIDAWLQELNTMVTQADVGGSN
jgi:hypothetical protein